MSNPLQYCRYCCRSMKYVSARSYAENPFCRDCLHDRLNRAGYRAGYAQAMRDAVSAAEFWLREEMRGCQERGQYLPARTLLHASHEAPAIAAIMALAAFLRPGGHG